MREGGKGTVKEEIISGREESRGRNVDGTGLK